MSASKLHAAGYQDLVPVIPPGADLTENSRIDPGQLGKVPGKRGRDEKYYGFNFISAGTPSEEDAAEFDRWGANIGLHGRHFPALDIDAQDPTLARVVQKFAEDRLGLAPVRLSREPRRLLVYRTDEPFARMALIITYKGESHLIEFLGDGRQYLVSGTHPSGVEYAWDGPALWELSPGDIPIVSRATVVEFFDALAHALSKKGIEVERVGHGLLKDTVQVPAESLLAPSLEALSALPLPPNPDHYGWDEFVQHGYAYAAASGHDEIGYDCWLAWAGQHPKFDEDQCRLQWDKGFKSPRVGWGWLTERAGYNTAQDEFDADPALAGAHQREANEAIRISVPDRIDFSDEWAVQLILPAVADRLRYVPGASKGTGTWHVWSGHKWCRDRAMKSELMVREQLRRVAIRLKERADAAPTKSQGGPFDKAAQRLQSASGIQSVLSLLCAHLSVQETDFDTDPMMLNTPAGVIDLSTGETRPSVPSDLFARSVTVAPASGKHPLWDMYLNYLTEGDPEYRSFLQRLAGYCLTGQMNEKVLAYAWGSESDTGKSQFIKVLMGLLGDYADTVDVEAFITSNKGSRVPADLARLPGVRMVTATEPQKGHGWDERRIKAITGGDEISARFLYGQWFTFKPQFKILVVGNHEPEIRHVDDAMLRRILILPFTNKVPVERQIPNLAEKMLEEEGPAILAWILDGCMAWQERGLSAPEVVVTQTAKYARDQDTLAQFLDEECELGAEHEISRHHLYRAWAIYCRSRDEDPGKEKGFKGLMAMHERKLDLKDAVVGPSTDRRRGYRGLRIRVRTETIGEEFPA